MDQEKKREIFFNVLTGASIYLVITAFSLVLGITVSYTTITIISSLFTIFSELRKIHYKVNTIHSIVIPDFQKV